MDFSTKKVRSKGFFVHNTSTMKAYRQWS